jgi:hypothetical protein
VAAVVAIGQARETDAAMAIEKLLAGPRMREVVDTRTIVLRVDQPHPGAPESMVEAWEGAELIAVARPPTSPTPSSPVADQIVNHVSDGGGDQQADR